MWTKGHELKYWNKNGLNKGPHIYILYRDSFNLENYDFQDKKIADIGCGPFGGIFYDREDIDYSPIDILAEEYNKMGCSDHQIVYGDLNFKIPFDDEFFDYIVCTNAIDHINDVQHGFNELFRILKIGGTAFVHIHMRSKSQLGKAHVHAIDMKKVVRLTKQFSVDLMREDTDWVNGRSDRKAMYMVLHKE